VPKANRKPVPGSARRILTDNPETGEVEGEGKTIAKNFSLPDSFPKPFSSITMLPSLKNLAGLFAFSSLFSTLLPTPTAMASDSYIQQYQGQRLYSWDGKYLSQYQGSRRYEWDGKYLSAYQGSRRFEWDGHYVSQYQGSRILEISGTRISRYQGSVLFEWDGQYLQKYQGGRIFSVDGSVPQVILALLAGGFL